MVNIFMKRTSNQHVGLDSNCLTFLLDCIANINEPIGQSKEKQLVADEQIALLRSWLYKPGAFAFILTETVISEVARIRDVERHEFHKSFIRPLFLDYPVRNLAAVQARTEQFAAHHNGLSDCRVLAEAEELGLNVVLTYDHKFRKHLSTISATTKLMTPSSYWTSLGIPKGATPVTAPHHTNPLSEQSWWRW
jgi:predicted nucleic acid-binding protein